MRAGFATLAACLACAAPALADGANVANVVKHKADSSHDGVYDRFDGDLDLGLGLGAELGSAGTVAPVARGSLHFFELAGLYSAGRFKVRDGSAPSLFDLGVDVRPLFVPRWAKGYENGPAWFDLALDSLSLSLGAFWAGKSPRRDSERGFEASLGFGLPLFARAAGPWLEARGALRYPDSATHEEAVILVLSW
ncbi:MAG TPA: hypothetical protein VHV51_12670, partial [Polyangiaceae bacterium]|nr:hypothetical protein [Polyangiaceae bacterium]